MIELMIAMTLGLILVSGIITIYVQSVQTNAELERGNRQMENGRFSIQLLRDELWHAGFWGEYSPGATLTPAADVNPCDAWSAWTAQNKADIFLLPVQGYNADPGVTEPTFTGCGTLFSNRKVGTDVLVVRHASNCLAGAAGCEADTAGKLYLQVSLCSSQTPSYVLNTAAFDRQKLDCATLAGKRKFLSRIYFVETQADGTPALVRSEFDLAGGTIQPQPAEVLIEGVEQFQVEYILDTTGDGNPNDEYITAAGIATGAQWNQVVAVKLHILARNLDKTPGHVDAKTYQLGAGATVGPFNDGYRRHVFTSVVRLTNPAGRKDT